MTRWRRRGGVGKARLAPVPRAACFVLRAVPHATCHVRCFVNATTNYTNLTSTVPSNLPYDANGNFVFANRNGFGTVNATRDPRIIQLVARLRF